MQLLVHQPSRRRAGAGSGIPRPDAAVRNALHRVFRTVLFDADLRARRAIRIRARAAAAAQTAAELMALGDPESEAVVAALTARERTAPPDRRHSEAAAAQVLAGKLPVSPMRPCDP